MKEKLRIAVRAFPPFESFIEKTWQQYVAATNCSFELEALPLELHDLHQSAIREKGLGTGDWDIAMLNTDWIAEAYEQGATEDLTPYIQQHSPEDYPQGWPASLLGMQQFDQHIAGLPFHDGPECLIYRKDLFDDPQEQAAYFEQYRQPLQPPATWDEFVQVAEFFQRPEQHLYGTAFAAYPDGHNTVFDFCLQLWTSGGSLYNEQGDVYVNSPEAIEGLKFYRQLLQNNNILHPQSHSFDSVQAGFAFAKGELAMMINWFGFASMCEVHEASVVKGNVNITQVPRGANGNHASLNVYWMYVIGAGSKQKETAYDFLRFATGKAQDKQLTLEGGIGCRLSTWHDADINATIPYYHQLDALHRHAFTLPRDAQWAAKATILDQAVTDAINSTIPVQDLLDRAQSAIEQLSANTKSNY
jgi:multiple sugar transport system substrate-binding protein